MRTLKECYEIAKKYHTYWTELSGHTEFMCLAASKAFDYCELTLWEYKAVSKDAMSLVKSLNKKAFSLKAAMGDPTDIEVKAYWDKYIDNMENQDG